MLSDIRAVADFHHVDVSTAHGGETGLATMWGLLSQVSVNRAYDDAHPRWGVAGIAPRILPYDGRDYCFYYADGCNDTHVATALRRIKAELTAVPA